MSDDSPIRLLVGGLHFPEGPVWHRGRLYFSDFYDHRVLSMDEAGNIEPVCTVPGQPSGLGFTPAGELLVVSMTDRRLLVLRDGELAEFADLSSSAPWHCNDLYVDRTGRAYVGNFGSDVDSEPIRETVLLRVDPDGSVHLAAEGLVFPNGMTTTPEGTLLVAETFAFRISEFDITPAGDLVNRSIWADFGPGPVADIPSALEVDAIAPDGICLDAEGRLWVADAIGNGAHLVERGGEISHSIDLGEDTAFSVALGGVDGRQLFLCAGPPLGEIDPASERRGAIVAKRAAVPGAGWEGEDRMLR